MILIARISLVNVLRGNYFGVASQWG